MCSTGHANRRRSPTAQRLEESISYLWSFFFISFVSSSSRTSLFTRLVTDQWIPSYIHTFTHYIFYQSQFFISLFISNKLFRSPFFHWFHFRLSLSSPKHIFFFSLLFHWIFDQWFIHFLDILWKKKLNLPMKSLIR